MANVTVTLNGVVHGDVIQLERPLGLPDGDRVSVTIESTQKIPEGLLRAFGAWADDAEELDEFVRQTYELRKLETRPPIEP